MNTIEAMKQALEALKDAHLLEVDDGEMGKETLDYSVPIGNLSTAIAEMEQAEPVAYLCSTDYGKKVLSFHPMNPASAEGDMYSCEPLYTHPAPAIPVGWRPEVAAFADAMEAKLRDNDDTGGWKDCAPHWLMMRLIGEASELLEELDPGTRAASQFYVASRMLLSACEELDQFGRHLKTKGDPVRVLGEAADVANFAMMLADVIAAPQPPKE